MTCVRLNCSECNKEFDKPKNEYNRRIKKGCDRFFCSLSCTRYTLNKENPPPGNPDNLRSDNRRDEYAQFRWFVRRVIYRARKKKYHTDITPEYLKYLWEQQKGICPFTGWDLILPHNSEKWSDDAPFSPRSASLDRIDNSKGYLKGNVRFIAVIANYARNNFSDKEVVDFARSVTEYSQK